MRKISAAAAALLSLLVLSLGVAAPASAASTGYIAKTCYVSGYRFTVSSWIENGNTKVYHWKAYGASASAPWRRAYDADIQWASGNAEGFLSTSNLSRDLWYGQWWTSTARTSTKYCGVTV